MSSRYLSVSNSNLRVCKYVRAFGQKCFISKIFFNGEIENSRVSTVGNATRLPKIVIIYNLVIALRSNCFLNTMIFLSYHVFWTRSYEFLHDGVQRGKQLHFWPFINMVGKNHTSSTIQVKFLGVQTPSFFSIRSASFKLVQVL